MVGRGEPALEGDLGGVRDAFQRRVQRRRPSPVESRLIKAHVHPRERGVLVGKWPRARTALRMRALTLSMAFGLQMTSRISPSQARRDELGSRVLPPASRSPGTAPALFRLEALCPC